MSKHATKAGLMDDIRLQRGRLEKNLKEFSPEEMEQPLIGDWSAKDVLAHLIDWEQRFIGWYEAGLRGETPETPAPGLSWRQLDVLNQRIYEKHKDKPLAEILDRFEASYEMIVELLDGLSEEELFTPGQYNWLNGDCLANWAAANTCNHYYWAKTQLHKRAKLTK